MKTAHAILAPSGADRWMPCPGSVAMEAQADGETNDYSDEGTAAHALSSMCLTINNDPAAYTGRILHVVNGVYWSGEGELPPMLKGWVDNHYYEKTVDDEMTEHVRSYVNAIRDYAKGHQLYIEQRVPIDHITGEKEAEGTSDAIIITADGKELQVHDLKYGMGVAVVAENNKQGMLYALGALRKYDLTGDIERVRIVIHQPRLLSAPLEWDCSIAELKAFGALAKQHAFHALATLQEKPAALQAHLHASEKACQFCKAKTICPELARTVSEAVFGDFKSLDDPQSNKAPIEFHPENVFGQQYEQATLDALATRMSKVELVEDWCKAIRAKTDLLLRSSIKVTGWKLVQGKRGNRKWKDESVVIGLLKKMRLKITEMYKMKVLTPTQAEEFFKPTPRRWKELEGLITQEPGKPHVAPESDPRPVYALPNVADDFAVIEEGSDLV